MTDNLNEQIRSIRGAKKVAQWSINTTTDNFGVRVIDEYLIQGLPGSAVVGAGYLRPPTKAELIESPEITHVVAFSARKTLTTRDYPNAVKQARLPVQGTPITLPEHVAEALDTPGNCWEFTEGGFGKAPFGMKTAFSFKNHEGRVSVMVVDNSQIGRKLYPEEKSYVRIMVDEFAELLAFKIEIEKLKFSIDDLKKKAFQCPMTGAGNQRAFQERFSELVEEVRSGKLERFFFVSSDLDRFKRVNDTYGHPVGDKVLMRFAEIGGKNMFHPHGEEFFTLIQGGTMVEAYRHMLECNRQLKATLFSGSSGTTFTGQSSSGGIVEVNAANITGILYYLEVLEKMDAAVDRLLYQAKESGRDRYCFCESEEHTIAA